MDCGVPVNPWQSRTPVSPPSWRYGSAPGMSGTVDLLFEDSVGGYTKVGRSAYADPIPGG